tara:strand:- start:475 stop:660 length:186 start_codon:yes stop_codon:yes gene_type:complete
METNNYYSNFCQLIKPSNRKAEMKTFLEYLSIKKLRNVSRRNFEHRTMTDRLERELSQLFW